MTEKEKILALKAAAEEIYGVTLTNPDEGMEQNNIEDLEEDEAADLNYYIKEKIFMRPKPIPTVGG